MELSRWFVSYACFVIFVTVLLEILLLMLKYFATHSKSCVCAQLCFVIDSITVTLWRKNSLEPDIASLVCRAGFAAVHFRFLFKKAYESKAYENKRLYSWQNSLQPLIECQAALLSVVAPVKDKLFWESRKRAIELLKNLLYSLHHSAK